MRKIKLVIEYDGSGYHGWQYQKNAISVQEVLSKAIKKLTGEDIIPDGAGRTDAGVHAYGQVASFITSSSIPAEKFTPALNTYLPDNISIIASEEADENFHARFSAKGKHYRYIIINRPQKSAIWASKAWHVRETLDFEAMNKAAGFFIGHKCFRAFCASGHSAKTFDRTVFYSQWHRDGEFLVYDTKGDGFLYNMVRIMVGTMVDIGKGRYKPEIIEEAIRNQQRNSIGVTAPPSGLYLMEVFY
ncbi:MAG: tRNA pseudouridine(38-40) synthase TruA [Clostridiaceae bacterium]|jgi:tRNA pseudouridine38-40 synthase|nr:tRNA pseudouridine(38-40) synthase TruA [Clostridiaceae bacterium]